MNNLEKTSLTGQPAVCVTRINYAASDFLKKSGKQTEKSTSIKLISDASTSAGSIINHCNKVYTDLDFQSLNPPLRRPHIKMSTSDRFMEHISGDNFLINPERAW